MRPGKHLKNPDGTCSENCWVCKQRSISFAPSAMATRFPDAARAKVKDPLLEKDREAYRRLRRNGEQPKHVGGSAFFEARANESCEITIGQIIADPSDRRQFAKGFDEMPTETRVRTSPDDAPIHQVPA